MLFLKDMMDASLALGLLIRILVWPFAIPLLGIGLERLWRGLRTSSEDEARKHLRVVALTWGLLLMALIGSHFPVW